MILVGFDLRRGIMLDGGQLRVSYGKARDKNYASLPADLNIIGLKTKRRRHRERKIANSGIQILLFYFWNMQTHMM